MEYIHVLSAEEAKNLFFQQVKINWPLSLKEIDEEIHRAIHDLKRSVDVKILNSEERKAVGLFLVNLGYEVWE